MPRFLLLDRELLEVLELLLGVQKVGRVGRDELLQQLMVLLLVLQRHPEVLLMIVRLGDGLVALYHLEMRVAIQSDVSVEALGETFDGCSELIAVLVHQPKVEDDRCRIRMIVAAHHLKDALCSVQVLEALRPVPALMIV